MKTTACSGDSLWGPGELSEKGLELVRAVETPARPISDGAGKTKSLTPKDARSNWLQINSHTGSFQKRRNRL